MKLAHLLELLAEKFPAPVSLDEGWRPKQFDPFGVDSICYGVSALVFDKLSYFELCEGVNYVDNVGARGWVSFILL